MQQKEKDENANPVVVRLPKEIQKEISDCQLKKAPVDRSPGGSILGNKNRLVAIDVIGNHYHIITNLYRRIIKKKVC